MALSSSQDAGDANKAGTIEMVSRRLLLWARRDGGGLARVEYASEFSRQQLLQRLRVEGIELVEIDLPASQTAAEAVEFLLGRLTEISLITTERLAEGYVVSVSGFARAFQPQMSLADSLRILNFNRESLTAFPLRQIWWMTPVLLDTSLHAMPDMHGWFNPQLSLTEVITQSVITQSVITQGVITQSAEGVFAAAPIQTERRSSQSNIQSNIDDARQRSRRLLAELEAARKSGAAETALVTTYLLPALEAIAQVGARQELKALTTQHKALLNHFYSMNSAEVLAALSSGEVATGKALSFARSLDKLVEVFYEQGLYAEAERLCIRALEIKKSELGDRHPDTASSLNDLAELYRSMGRYGEAEPLYLDALAIRKAELGDRHPDTAGSLNNLALLYASMGRYGEAEPLYLDALAIRKAELGDRHPSTATSLNNLAALYKSQGRYGEAEPLLLDALAIRKAELGDRHPSTAQGLNNLAALYKSQGRYGEAEPLYLDALAIWKAELGDRHPDTATSLLNLAALYYNTQRHQQALDPIKQALAIYIPALGADHPTTQNATNWLQLIQQAIDAAAQT